MALSVRGDGDLLVVLDLVHQLTHLLTVPRPVFAISPVTSAANVEKVG
ncbi:hypothetical protein [Streptomyces pacificus]|nr:hypothetical protein [Streptomyces pacificus]